MQPIADMEDDQFMKLQTRYASELPICPICSLEDARHLLSDIVFDAPNAVSDGVRQLLRVAVHRDRCARVEPNGSGAGRSGGALSAFARDTGGAREGALTQRRDATI